MEIPLPPGYASAVPFDKEKHRRLGIASSGAAFARSLNFVYITTAEFPRAGHDYPIAFARDAAGTTVPIVITGMDAGTNLFIDDNDNWDAQTYCPAYVRRFPFFTATLNDAGPDGGQALICVDEKALAPDATSLVNAAGEPTKRWREIEVLITEMDKEQRVTDVFCRRLEALDLLEPFDADFHPRGKSLVRVGGMLRVNERRLLALDGNVQIELLREGSLARIYAHLLSLENFNRLLDRYASQPN